MKHLKSQYDGIFDLAFLNEGEKVDTVDGNLDELEITSGDKKIRVRTGQIISRQKDGSLKVTGKPVKRAAEKPRA